MSERPTALIMTSKYEGLSMVMLETVARGIPVITSKFKSYDDIVKENINGYSYPMGNIKELAKSIEKVANNNLNPMDVKNSISEYYPKEYFKRLDSSLEYFLDD
ncbi:glycosyltransferase [Ligilactobacillus salivarius]|uniref:glycosyltransferase n=1 Tax=Ligilactobacillus salivarius TaxID=1624 RepID=UPI00214EF1CC|nr:glycosyltransferase [Ligilactobacillus salivarius]UUV97195.1 glycosyltransferase [Ligilactobacillus salivarius]